MGSAFCSFIQCWCSGKYLPQNTLGCNWAGVNRNTCLDDGKRNVRNLGVGVQDCQHRPRGSRNRGSADSGVRAKARSIVNTRDGLAGLPVSGSASCNLAVGHKMSIHLRREILRARITVTNGAQIHFQPVDSLPLLIGKQPRQWIRLARIHFTAVRVLVHGRRQRTTSWTTASQN